MRTESADQIKELRKEIAARKYPRKEVAAILDHYNRSIGNDDFAMRNVSRLLKKDSVCVVTGQQLGFMCGPSYTILKAITCILAARKFDAIPIFWLATEDHDIGEIDHTYTLDELGNIQKHHISLLNNGTPVEELILTDENIEEIDQFFCLAGVSDCGVSYKAGDSYSLTMVSVLVELFRETGLVFVEPHSIRSLGMDFFVREVEEQEDIYQTLSMSTSNLRKQGLETPIDLDRNSTNLFIKNEKHQRMKIVVDGSDFRVGDCKYTKSELVNWIQCCPGDVSGNVAARPIIQSLVFPTLAYIGGPTEVAYYRQLGEYFKFHNIPAPCVFPRLSQTCVTPKCREFLDAAHLNATDPIPGSWKEVFDEFAVAADKKEIKMQLEMRGIPYHALHYLNNFLHPHTGLQERNINWLWLQSQADESIIQHLLREAVWDQYEHKYYFINE